MSAANSTRNDLQWKVLTIRRPGLTRDLPPGKEELMWVANSSTLIYGERDAVLVGYGREHLPLARRPSSGLCVLQP